MILAGSFLYPHFVKIPPWAKRSSSRGRTTLRCGTGKIRPRLTEETKQYQQQQFPRKKFNQQQQQQFYLSFSFCFYSFSYTLFSWLMVRLWLGFRALPEGVSEVLFFEKKSDIFLFVFCRFSVVFP
jgi:hypothetical protein